MSRNDDLYTLPDDLVAPDDDGAAVHLQGLELPHLALPATDGRLVNLRAPKGRTVVYCYPRTGRPGVASAAGWNDIPGARGCTPQSCAFRDNYGELLGRHTSVFGLSTQRLTSERPLSACIYLTRFSAMQILNSREHWSCPLFSTTV